MFLITKEKTGCKPSINVSCFNYEVTKCLIVVAVIQNVQDNNARESNNLKNNDILHKRVKMMHADDTCFNYIKRRYTCAQFNTATEYR